jgi:uncharacterized membrane protein YgaE (UPF0421/DUF939 family)
MADFETSSEKLSKLQDIINQFRDQVRDSIRDVLKDYCKYDDKNIDEWLWSTRDYYEDKISDLNKKLFFYSSRWEVFKDSDMHDMYKLNENLKNEISSLQMQLTYSNAVRDQLLLQISEIKKNIKNRKK